MSESMSVLRFDVIPLAEGQMGVAQVVPVIDGTSLVTLVAAHEEARGYKPAGGYGGLVPSFFRFGDLSRYYLGEQEPWTGKPVAVLACDCGELGCWPLQTRISVDDETASWRDFGQPHRPEWDYEDLGPFTFDRRAYETELEQMVVKLASEGEAP